MKLALLLLLFISPFVSSTQTKEIAKHATNPSTKKVAKDFKALLSRQTVDFKASFQSYPSDSVLIEKGFINSEENERIPVLIYKPVKSSLSNFPVVICLHGTGGNKEDESIKNLMLQLTRNGIMGVAIDARYHGERVKGGANGSQQYVDAITRVWKNTNAEEQEHPFYFDTVYDLWRLTDYLSTRADVDASRLGMMGISMGGIEAWMAASVDKRIKVTVPIIAAQSFKWSLENNMWQGRARTIWKAHQTAAKDLGDTGVNKQNVNLLWNKLIPGITEEFDCPSMIRLFAPRPLLLLNNEKDMNCPLPGAKIAFEAATKEYKSKNALDKLSIHVTPNEPHRFLPEHLKMTVEWFKKWL